MCASRSQGLYFRILLGMLNNLSIDNHTNQSRLLYSQNILRFKYYYHLNNTVMRIIINNCSVFDTYKLNRVGTIHNAEIKDYKYFFNLK